MTFMIMSNYLILCPFETLGDNKNKGKGENHLQIAHRKNILICFHKLIDINK